MKLLGIDLETSGLDASKGEILEVGAALFDVPSRTIIYQFSTLCYAECNPAEHINNISVPALLCVNQAMTTDFLGLFNKLINMCDALIAHNNSFEKQWLGVHMPWIDKSIRWLCTRYDFKWPNTVNLKLQSIAGAMGVPYMNAHRALPDVNIMFDCLARLPDLEAQLSNLLPPAASLPAVPPPPFFVGTNHYPPLFHPDQSCNERDK